MQINKLSASFGKLADDTLELHEGLNVICAPNESGKSTWCAFIRAMLYGVDSSERQKIGYLPDKTRYAPWSGAPMQGSMELTAGGRDISLVRRTKTNNAPMREFSAVYSGTNIPVEGMTGQNAGEMLTGVGREVFRRSAFVEQGAIAVSGSPELEKRISAIVSTGEDGCSFTEADSQLRAWQRKRRYNRRGRLPELEERMSDTKRRIASLEEASQRKDALTAELERAKSECAQLEAAVTESRKSVRKEALSSLLSMRNEINEASREHERTESERETRRQALRESVIGERDPEQVRGEVVADMEQALALKAESERKISAVPALICLLLGIIAAVLGVLVSPYAYIAAALLCVAAVALYVRCSRAKAAAHDAGRQRKNILLKYKAGSEDDIKRCEDEFLELYGQLKRSEEAEREAAEQLAALRRRQEQTESRTLADLDFSGGDNEAARLSRALTSAQSRCDMLSAQISEIKGAIATMGDPLVLGSELRAMEDEHAELEAEFEAIALAVETLRHADADIQSRFSPELGRLAAHYMSIVTDGKYDSVLINRDFSARVREAGGGVPRETEYLSAGTLDLMYLAVRLAVCTLALPESANCPLILDDALVNFDAERTAQAMTLLREIAKQRQVILFTCKNVE